MSTAEGHVPDEDYTRSLHRWNDSVVSEYRDSHMHRGDRYSGTSLIIVHHLGARSGLERVNPLTGVAQSDGSILLAASFAGARSHPAWYHNLKAHPDVTVEFAGEEFAVRADELPPEERDAMWPTMQRHMPELIKYQAMTPRTIPVVRLRPV